jgi:hypothetical protein
MGAVGTIPAAALIWLLGDVQGRAARLADEHAQIV